MPMVTHRVDPTTARAQSRDQTVRATFDSTAGFHIRVKPGCVSDHSSASLATALQEAASGAFRAFHFSHTKTAENDPRWRELLAKIAALRAVEAGPREAIRVTWQKNTPQVAVRRVILDWDATEVAEEATAATNATFDAFGERMTELFQSTLAIQSGKR